MTFSIVARDPESGEIGAAVATGWPAVGSVVPWVEPGAGAIVTQAFTNIDLGPEGLALLREGLPADAVLERLLASDPEPDLRQLGIVDLAGGVAAHTGSDCVVEAGHLTADGVSVQANMVERPSVWPAVLEAFEHEGGDVADRLLAALVAGEREGGDLRGHRSAALIVAPSAAGVRPWTRRFDLRVDLAARPLDELARALAAARAYELLPAALKAVGDGELDLALEQSAKARDLAPNDAQVTFWHAVLLKANGRTGESEAALDEALRTEPRLAEFARRYAESNRAGALAPILREIG